MRWRVATYRGHPTQRRWLLVGRAMDTRGRIRGLSFCWVTGMWAFWIERRPVPAPKPRTFIEQLLDDAKRMVPIDTGRLRANVELDDETAAGYTDKGALTWEQFSGLMQGVEDAYRSERIPCGRCGSRPASSHDIEGWLCDPCGDELYPRFEG